MNDTADPPTPARSAMHSIAGGRVGLVLDKRGRDNYFLFYLPDFAHIRVLK